ncbi:hypothetical protein [Roseibacillus persicicus]|uniref:hypothetical protein n=1 Tax=Roseibacillus persicicus TaxID=454148 RepID=UPI00167B6242|nr:hypothetical protein [Roseibacillus persicicus]
MSYTQKGEAFQIIDRQVSMVRGSAVCGIHDDNFNKTVVCHGSDGVCSISFTGNAYLNKTPMDQAIAESLSGGPLNPSLVKCSSPGVPDMEMFRILESGFSELWSRINLEATLPISLTAECVGIQYKNSKRRFIPFLRRYSFRKGTLKKMNVLKFKEYSNTSTISAIGDFQGVLTEEIVRSFEEKTNSQKRLSNLLKALSEANLKKSTVGKSALIVQMLPSELMFPEKYGASPQSTASTAIAFDSEYEDEQGLIFTPWILTSKSYQAPSAQQWDGANLAAFMRRRTGKDETLFSEISPIGAMLAFPRKKAPPTPKPGFVSADISAFEIPLS